MALTGLRCAVRARTALLALTAFLLLAMLLAGPGNDTVSSTAAAPILHANGSRAQKSSNRKQRSSSSRDQLPDEDHGRDRALGGGAAAFDDEDLTLAESLRAHARFEIPADYPWHMVDLTTTRAETFWLRRVQLEYQHALDSASTALKRIQSSLATVERKKAVAQAFTAWAQAADTYLRFLVDDARPFPEWRPGPLQPIDLGKCGVPSRFSMRRVFPHPSFSLVSPRSLLPDVSHIINVPRNVTQYLYAHSRTNRAAIPAGSFKAAVSRLAAQPFIATFLLNTQSSSQAELPCLQRILPPMARVRAEPSLLDGAATIALAMHLGTPPVVCEYVKGVIEAVEVSTLTSQNEQPQSSSVKLPRSAASAGLPQEILQMSAALALVAYGPHVLSSCGISTSDSTASGLEDASRSLRQHSHVLSNRTHLDVFRFKLRQYAARSLGAPRLAYRALTAVPAFMRVLPTRVLVIVNAGGHPATDAARSATPIEVLSRDAAAVAFIRGLLGAGVDVVAVFPSAQQAGILGTIVTQSELVDAALGRAALEADTFWARRDRRVNRRGAQQSTPVGMLLCEKFAAAFASSAGLLLVSTAASQNDSLTSTATPPGQHLAELGQSFVALQAACAPGPSGHRDQSPNLAAADGAEGHSQIKAYSLALGDDESHYLLSDDGTIVFKNVGTALREGAFEAVVYHLADLAAVHGFKGVGASAPGAYSHHQEFRREHGHGAAVSQLMRQAMPHWAEVTERFQSSTDHVVFLVSEPLRLPAGLCRSTRPRNFRGSDFVTGGRGWAKRPTRSTEIAWHEPDVLHLETSEERLFTLSALGDHGTVLLRDALDCDEVVNF
jgi:hypothetical protein